MSSTWNHTDFHDLSWKNEHNASPVQGGEWSGQVDWKPNFNCISFSAKALLSVALWALKASWKKSVQRPMSFMFFHLHKVLNGFQTWYALLTSLVVWACPSPNTCEAGKVEGFPAGPVGGRSVEVGPVDGCRWFVWKIGDFFKMEFQVFFLKFCYILNSKHHLPFEHGQEMGLGSMFRLGEMDADGNTLARCWCPAMRSRWPDFGRKDLRSHLV